MPTHTPQPDDPHRVSLIKRCLLVLVALLFPPALAYADRLSYALVACRCRSGPLDDPVVTLALGGAFIASLWFIVHAFATERVMLVQGKQTYTGKCLNCRYDLTGLPRQLGVGQCPECGIEFREDGLAIDKARQQNSTRAIIAMLGLLLCMGWPILVDLGWRLIYTLQGRGVEFIDRAEHTLRSVDGINSRYSLPVQLYLIMLALAIAARFAPLARPARTIFKAHLCWTIIFTLLTLPHFEHQWWWTGIPVGGEASWYCLPLFAGFIAWHAPRLPKQNTADMPIIPLAHPDHPRNTH